MMNSASASNSGTSTPIPLSTPNTIKRMLRRSKTMFIDQMTEARYVVATQSQHLRSILTYQGN